MLSAVALQVLKKTSFLEPGSWSCSEPESVILSAKLLYLVVFVSAVVVIGYDL